MKYIHTRSMKYTRAVTWSNAKNHGYNKPYSQLKKQIINLILSNSLQKKYFVQNSEFAAQGA